LSMSAPIWLDETSEVRALLNAALDRFDKQAGEARARSILLDIEKFLPTLSRNDSNADQTWELIRDLERAGVFGIRLARNNQLDSPWVGARAAFLPSCENQLREWLQRPAPPRVMQQWREAVARWAHVFADAGVSLSARRITVAGRSNDEVVMALTTLASVEQEATLRQLSAFAFWGDSKILDDRGDLVSSLFPKLSVRDREIIVAAFLPATIQGVLFIENQDTYVSAIKGCPIESRDHALVYMSGFKGAAQRIRSVTGSVLHCCGPGAQQHAAGFNNWWFARNSESWRAYFWGDLDFAGMQILRALRQRFEGVTAWQPGYSAMLDSINQGRGHARDGETLQSDPSATGCAYADDVLLPAIRAHGFYDQETIASAADSQLPD
jgi:hypothetical protein